MAQLADMDVLVQPDRVHRDLYTDPDVFDAEMRRIFESTWVFVGHDSEVTDPGDFKTGWIGRQPFIMSRSDDGTVHVLLNRCMHRGASVCREERGNARSFRCIYHGWTYNARGDLVGVTYKERYGPNFDQAALALPRPARVDSYRGFVFASMNPSGVSLAEHLGRAKAYIDLIVEASPEGKLDVRAGVQKYSFPANWKFQIENWTDGYHPNITHQTAFEAAGPTHKGGSHMGSAATSRTFGRGHCVLDYSSTRSGKWSTLARKDPDYMDALKKSWGDNRAAEVLQKDVQLLVFPNLFFQKDRQHFRVVRPLAHDQTEIYAYPYNLVGAPEKVNREMIAGLAWWASAAGFGQPDDVEAFVRCQEGLRVTAAEWLLFLRGIEEEQVDADGEIFGDVTDEVPQRGIYREWKRLMSVSNGDARPA
jgi:phenylpropionate dioxygenase-like ring-hydroxylating dioxygenase large terminal subunit